MARVGDRSEARSLRQRFGFAAPMAPLAALHAPMLATMPAVYAKYAPIGLAQIAAGMFALRLLDALLDPLIGYASDRTPVAWGRRKLWVAGGLLLAIPTSYFWLRPGPATGLSYFLFWTAAASLCWALVEIAHGAWVAELSADYDARIGLAFWRTEALYVGGICFAATPLLPFLSSTKITPESLAAGSWIIMAGLVIALVAMLAWAPVGSISRSRPRRSHRAAVWRAMVDSKPLRLLVFQVTCSSLASGMVGALFFFFVDAYLGILDRLAYIALGTFAVGMAAAPLWPPVIRSLGRSRVQASSLAITALTVVAMAYLPPGDAGFMGLASLFAVTAALTVGREVNVVTLVADAADDDDCRSGENKAGLFFAAVTVAQKAGIAFGGASALLIASGFGFDPKARIQPAAMEGFLLAFTVVPCLLYALAALLAARFPIDRAAHDVLQKQLSS